MASAIAFRRISLNSAGPPRQGKLSTKKDVFGGCEGADERQVLVDRLDAEPLGLDRPRKRDCAPFKLDLSERRLMGAREDLDERGLARAIVADKTNDVPGGESNDTLSSARIPPKVFETPFT